MLRIQRRRWMWSAAALIVVAAALVAVGTRKYWDPTSGSPVSATTTAASQPVTTGATGLQDAFVSVVSRVRPSVVEISTSQGLGSGIVYDAKGDIVTNAHVVGSATAFQVTLPNGQTLNGTLVGTYAPDDLAVIKVSDTSLAPLAFADSSQVQVGDLVLAVGNPLGLASSVTEGIVSATGRTVNEGGGVILPSTIQTSASINPGNSGGSLVNVSGQVIGIPTLAAVDPQLGGTAAAGIGFAIPSNTVVRIANQLIAGGQVTNSGRAALGVVATTALGPTGQRSGVLVRSSSDPAKSAGIQAGDIITAVNGTATPGAADLAELLAGMSPGQKVTVDVTHANGQKQSYQLTLGTL
jgi:putative serine protease PepD